MTRLDRFGNPIGREIQKPNLNAPQWTESGLSREYNDIWKNNIRNLGRYPNPNELPEIIQQMKETKQIINDFYQGKINFNERFLDKVSYTYKGNFRPFGRLYPTGIPTQKSTHEGVTYSEFLSIYQHNLSPVRVEDIQQIGIDEDITEPESEFEYVNGQMIIPAPQTFIKTTKGEELELIPKPFAETPVPEVEIVTPDRTGIAFSVALIAVVIGYVILRRIR